MKPKTRMAIILDKSGSMEETKKQAISGLNEQIQEARQLSAEHDLKCSLVTFNGKVYEHLWDVPAEQLEEASEEDFMPDGSTAMRDAIGYTTNKLLETASEDDKDTAYLIYIISDGDTNTDKHYSVSKLKALIEKCQKTGRWTFTYMGCSEEYLNKVSQETSVPIANMAVWSNTTDSGVLRAFDEQKVKMKSYFNSRKSGIVATTNYASEVDGVCANYTEDVSSQILANSVNHVSSQVDLVNVNNQLGGTNCLDLSHKPISTEKRGPSWMANSKAATWK